MRSETTGKFLGNLLGKKTFTSTRCIVAVFSLMVGISVLQRVLSLSHIPGMNGDEAWHGWNALKLIFGGDVIWTTPQGRVSSPIFLLLNGFVHQFFEPSVLTSRLVSCVSGVLLPVLAFLLFSKLWSRSQALLFAAFIALLPLHVAYSRQGVEASQIAFGSLFVLYFVEKRSRVGIYVALLVAQILHPTNIFLVPMAFFSVLSQGWDSTAPIKTKLRSALYSSAPCALIALFALAYSKTSQNGLGIHPPTFGTFFQFIVDYAAGISGISVYRDFAGLTYSTTTSAIVFVTLLLLGAMTVVTLFKKSLHNERPVFIGLLLSLGLLYLMTGNVVIGQIPRYLLFGTVPFAYVLVTFITQLGINHSRPLRMWGAAASLSLYFVVSFELFYFEPFRNNGGGGPPNITVYRTGSTEPKSEAFQEILKQRKVGNRTYVLAEDWNLYWPLLYFSHPYPDIQVSGLLKDVIRPENMKGLLSRRGIVVGFPDKLSKRSLSYLYDNSELNHKHITNGQQHLVSIWTLKSNSKYPASTRNLFPVRPENDMNLLFPKTSQAAHFAQSSLFQLAQGKTDKAIGAYLEAVEMAPSLVLSQAKILDSFSTPELKKELVKRWLANLGKRPLTVALLDTFRTNTKFQKTFERALREASTRAQTRQQIFEASRVLIQQARAPLALGLLKAWSQVEPKSPDLANWKGAALLSLGQFGPARDAFFDALKLKPLHRPTLANLQSLHSVFPN